MPSCNVRRMAKTAAHFVDHVFPPHPVSQWLLLGIVGGQALRFYSNVKINVVNCMA